MMSDSVVVLAVLLMTSVAVITDLRHNRIPNSISIVGILGGIALHIAAGGGLSGVASSIGGALFGGALLMPFYMMKGMAAGDVKLMAAVGAIVGWPHAVEAVAYTLVSGSVLALFYIIIRGGGIEFVTRFVTFARHLIRAGELHFPAAQAGSVARSRFPYALAIATGGLFAAW